MESPAESGEEPHARIRQQEVVAELGQQALETDDLDQLMHDASVAVADTLGNDYCKVLELLPDGNEVFLRQGVGWREGLVGNATVPTDLDSQAGYTLLSEEPIFVDDLRTEDRFSGPELLTSHDVISGISVIIGSVDDPWGVLGTHTTEPVEFTEGDATFVQSVANILASAIENHQTKQPLRDEKERFRQLVEEVEDYAIFMLDRNGDIQSWNKGAEQIKGYAEEEILGEHVSTFYPDEAVEEGLPDRLLTEAAAEGRTEHEGWRVREDGSRFWASVSITALYDDDELRGFTKVTKDLTERREREHELERYETIVEAVNDGVYVVDEDSTFQMVNETYAEMLGYSPDELVGTNATTLIDDEAIEPVDDLLAATAEGDVEQPSMEAKLRTASGEWLPVEATFAPLPEGDDSDWERVGVVRDISERKERERALKESERRYRTLAENFPDGAVGLFDEDLRYTAAGGELLAATGMEPEERIGSSVYEIYPDELFEEVESYFHAALEGESNSFEVEYHDRHLFAHTMPVRNADDEVDAGMLVIQDVTERREYQRQLEESNERLEQFAYAASHDLQEPLRMVSSYLQLIEGRYGDDLDEDGEEFLEFAVDGADRMRAMIDGLLQYARVETEGEPLEPVDLDTVLDDVRENLYVRIEESDAQITTDSLPRIEGDEGQLRQVFQNLLSNAIEYSGDEPPQVYVSAERNGPEWTVLVSDEGVGIDPDDQERIFEVFQRGHSTEESSGTGIGLALCERIIERHGSDIRIESDPGEGATFSFTLPAVQEESDG